MSALVVVKVSGNNFFMNKDKSIDKTATISAKHWEFLYTWRTIASSESMFIRSNTQNMVTAISMVATQKIGKNKQDIISDEKYDVLRSWG